MFQTRVEYQSITCSNALDLHNVTLARFNLDWRLLTEGGTLMASKQMT